MVAISSHERKQWDTKAGKRRHFCTHLFDCSSRCCVLGKYNRSSRSSCNASQKRYFIEEVSAAPFLLVQMRIGCQRAFPSSFSNALQGRKASLSSEAELVSIQRFWHIKPEVKQNLTKLRSFYPSCIHSIKM